VDHDHLSPADIHRDEIAGFWPGVYFAVAIGVITGIVVGTVFLAWLWLVASGSGFAAGFGGIVTALGSALVFWIGLGLGLVLGFATGIRAWFALYPIATRRADARHRREAVAAAESLIRGTRREPAGPEE
jgi:hypothetical protein